METEIIRQRSIAIAQVKLLPHDGVQASAGALIAMHKHVTVTSSSQMKRHQGLAGLVSRVNAQLFINSYMTEDQSAEIYLGQALPGDMLNHWLEDEGMIIQVGSFIGADKAIALELNWGGFRAVLDHQELLWIHASGAGEVILGAFGQLQEITIGERLVVATNHLVAFEDSLNFSVHHEPKLAEKSGPLLCEFAGKGRVWCQSHDRAAMGQALSPYLQHLD